MRSTRSSFILWTRVIRGEVLQLQEELVEAVELAFHDDLERLLEVQRTRRTTFFALNGLDDRDRCARASLPHAAPGCSSTSPARDGQFRS